MGGDKNNVANKALVLCLVLQGIIFQVNSIETPGGVEFEILVKNEMYDLKRPSVYYQCKTSQKSLEWHKSVPNSEFSWEFEVAPYGNGVVIHRCEFLSSQGTAEVEIKTLSMTSILCGGNVCKYIIRPNGIYFIGFETYYPHNVLLKFLEFVRPVETLVEPWKAWSPRQLKALRRQHINRNSNRSIYVDKDDDVKEEDDEHDD